MAKSFSNKIAVITGASSGIGMATAEMMTAKGAQVIALNRRETKNVEFICTDVTSEDAVNSAAQDIMARHGKIDILVCNAGMGISGATESTSNEDVRHIFELNFFGVLNTIKAFIPYMRDGGGGTIVIVSSVASMLSIPFQSFYSATKAATTSLADSLRIELKPFNIKVVSVLPGDVKTDFTASRKKNTNDDPAYGDRIAKSIAVMEHDETHGMNPKVVASDICRVVSSSNPPVQIISGCKYKMLVKLAHLLPKRAVSYILGKMYGGN